MGSIPGLGRSLEEGMTTHSSILAWRIPWATVHRVAKSQTQLKRHSTHAVVPHKAAVRFIGSAVWEVSILRTMLCITLRLCFSPVYNPSVVPYFHLSTRQTPAQPSGLGSWVCFSGSPGKLIYLGSVTFFPSGLHLEPLTVLSAMVQSSLYRVIIFLMGSEPLENKDCGFFLQKKKKKKIFKHCA